MPWDCDFARERISLISSSLVFRMPSCWKRTSCVPRGGLPDCAGREGQPILECTCGLVLTGRTDPDNPCFTEGGDSGQIHLRNCSRFRPRPISVQIPATAASMPATNRLPLVPLRSGDEIVGLLQLNARRPRKFTPELCPVLRGPRHRDRHRLEAKAGRRGGATKRDATPCGDR